MLAVAGAVGLIPLPAAFACRVASAWVGGLFPALAYFFVFPMVVVWCMIAMAYAEHRHRKRWWVSLLIIAITTFAGTISWIMGAYGLALSGWMT